MDNIDSRQAQRTHKLHTTRVNNILNLAVEQLAPRLNELLAERTERLNTLSAGAIERETATAHIRKSHWEVEPLPEALKEFKVSLTGSATREDVIEGMNADCGNYIADLWNLVPQKSKILYRAHRNLQRALNNKLTRLDSNAKTRINATKKTKLTIVPRPLHVREHSVEVGGTAVCAALYDIVLHCVLNGTALITRQGAVLLALRRVFNHLEARWYARLFELIEEEMGWYRGTIKTGIIVDSIEGALQMDEILFELRAHAFMATLDPQRYAFSHIQLFSSATGAVMPDRERIDLESPMLKAAMMRLLSVAHHRGVLALFPVGYHLHPADLDIPVDGYHEMVLEIKAGLESGFDGGIVANNGAIGDLRRITTEVISNGNQLSVKHIDGTTAVDLTVLPEGELSTASLIQMVRTALRYRMAERVDRPWAVQGGRKHDRSSMKLAIAILRQWRNSDQGVISQSGLPVDDTLLRYLVEKETTKMFGSNPELLPAAKEEAEFILAQLRS